MQKRRSCLLPWIWTKLLNSIAKNEEELRIMQMQFEDLDHALHPLFSPFVGTSFRTIREEMGVRVSLIQHNKAIDYVVGNIVRLNRRLELLWKFMDWF